MRTSDERGFTLIEMLIVCITIGTLAAIALPAFLSQSQKAEDSHAKQHVNTAAKTLEVLRNDSSTYALPPSALTDLEPSLSGAVNLTVAGTRDTFTVGAESDSGVRYEMTRSLTGLVRSCAPAGRGGCASTADAAGNSW